MNRNNSIVATYPTHTAAEAAIKELIVNGSAEDTIHAKDILNHTKPDTLEHHQ